MQVSFFFFFFKCIISLYFYLYLILWLENSRLAVFQISQWRNADIEYQAEKNLNTFEPVKLSL